MYFRMQCFLFRKVGLLVSGRLSRIQWSDKIRLRVVDAISMFGLEQSDHLTNDNDP